MTDMSRRCRTHETLDAGDCRFDLRILETDEGAHILRIRPEGRITRETQRTVLTFLTQDPRFDITLRTLWDVRAIDFDAQSLSVIRGVVFVISEYPDRIGVKRGFLVGTETAYGVMRLFQETASGFGVEDQDNMLVSMDEDELLQWLCT